MAKHFTPKVITANALLQGDAVWLTEDDRWSHDIADAELLTDETHAELRLIEASQRQAEVAGPYLADAVDGPDGPAPAHFRETFRTRGPSNYAHGKQAKV